MTPSCEVCAAPDAPYVVPERSEEWHFSAFCLRCMDDMLSWFPLTVAEFDRLERFIAEASIPESQRFYCCHPDCARVFSVDREDVPVESVLESLRRKTF